MSAPTKESTLQRNIQRAITEEWPEALVYKIHGSPMQTAGIPDLIICLKGQFVGLEVKLQRPGESREAAYGRASEAQRRQLAAIENAGGAAAIVLSVEEALGHLRAVASAAGEVGP